MIKYVYSFLFLSLVLFGNAQVASFRLLPVSGYQNIQNPDETFTFNEFLQLGSVRFPLGFTMESLNVDRVHYTSGVYLLDGSGQEQHTMNGFDKTNSDFDAYASLSGTQQSMVLIKRMNQGSVEEALVLEFQNLTYEDVPGSSVTFKTEIFKNGKIRFYHGPHNIDAEAPAYNDVSGWFNYASGADFIWITGETSSPDVFHNNSEFPDEISGYPGFPGPGFAYELDFKSASTAISERSEPLNLNVRRENHKLLISAANNKSQNLTAKLFNLQGKEMVRTSGNTILSFDLKDYQGVLILKVESQTGKQFTDKILVD